jgi:hypothetical protein
VRKRRAAAADRRAAALLRWYPAGWRARYGDEFAELLAADLAERPSCWRRTADIVRCGLSARLGEAGLTARALDPAAQVRASLATVSCGLAAFLTLGLAMLAQLAIGWQWTSPGGAATTAGSVLMCGAAGAVALLGVIAAVPLAGRALAGLIRGRQPGWPAGLLAAGGLVLVAGAHHFQSRWPGTGGMAGYRGLVPGGLAAFGWASTLAVSSYWAHPGVLAGFPVLQLAWVVLSPVALLGLAAGTAAVIRRQPLPPRLAAREARLAGAAALAACVFFSGAACWVFGPGSAAAGLFHAGVMDVAGLGVMAVALAATVRAAGSARRGAAALAVRGTAG